MNFKKPFQYNEMYNLHLINIRYFLYSNAPYQIRVKNLTFIVYNVWINILITIYITPFAVTWTIIALSIQPSAFSPQLSAYR